MKRSSTVGPGGGHTWHFCKAVPKSRVRYRAGSRSMPPKAVRAAVLPTWGLRLRLNGCSGRNWKTAASSVLLTEWALPPIDLWAMYPTGRMASAKARAFVAFVEEILAR